MRIIGLVLAIIAIVATSAQAAAFECYGGCDGVHLLFLPWVAP